MEDKITHIIEPFWGAWKIYGWGEGIPGIGLSERLVMNHAISKKPIRVKIGEDKTVYKISPVSVVNLAKKYNSVRAVSSGVKVAVIPRNQFIKEEENGQT